MANKADVKDELVPLVSLVLEDDGISKNLVPSGVGGDCPERELLLRYYVHAQRVKDVFGNGLPVFGDLAADDRSLDRVELGEEDEPERSLLSTALALSCRRRTAMIAVGVAIVVGPAAVASQYRPVPSPRTGQLTFGDEARMGDV